MTFLANLFYYLITLTVKEGLLVLDAINNTDNQESELGQVLLVGSGLMSKGKRTESIHGILPQRSSFIDSDYS